MDLLRPLTEDTISISVRKNGIAANSAGIEEVSKTLVSASSVVGKVVIWVGVSTHIVDFSIVFDRHCSKNSTTPASTRIIDYNPVLVGQMFCESFVEVTSSEGWKVHRRLGVPYPEWNESFWKYPLTFPVHSDAIDPTFRVSIHI